jgi:hypothetical protein
MLGAKQSKAVHEMLGTKQSKAVHEMLGLPKVPVDNG